jgi:mannose-6-phosphate isomerase-like protein (cupin superfamily)
MAGYVINIEQETVKNENFRKVLYTANYSQLVVMSLDPGEDIGEEVHGLDQFIRVEEGEGKVILDGKESAFNKDFAVVIPAGTRHNVVNTSSNSKMKLYTLYSPPDHKRDTVHVTKADAQSDIEDHFDGVTD